MRTAHRTLAAVVLSTISLAITSPAFGQTIWVDGNVAVTGDGSRSRPTRTITEALALAAELRARSSKQIIIDVAPHEYVGSYTALGAGIERLPLVLVENTWLRGATHLLKDRDGLPTGETVPGTETLLRPDVPLGSSQAFIWIPEDDVRLSGLVVDGQALAGVGPTRGIAAERVSGLVVEKNVIKGFDYGLTTRLSSGTVSGNYVTGTSLGLLFEGGPAEDGVSLLVTANRSERNSVGSGIFGAPDVDPIRLSNTTLSDPILATELSRITVDYQGNDFRMNLIAGVRLFVFASGPGLQQRAEIGVSATGNRFDCNGAYGFIADTFAPAVKGGFHHSRVDAYFDGNQMIGNGRGPLMLSFLRFQQAILPMEPPVLRPLEQSTFTVTGDVTLVDADLWHLETTNTLFFNGVTLPFGRMVHPTQPAVCPAS